MLFSTSGILLGGGCGEFAGLSRSDRAYSSNLIPSESDPAPRTGRARCVVFSLKKTLRGLKNSLPYMSINSIKSTLLFVEQCLPVHQWFAFIVGIEQFLCLFQHGSCWFPR